ncbi:MAG: sigma-54 dependent transcriptional regulator [Thermodesulfovibrionales bacterium]|nr:sigma-54 dependent transcriptional regulator [Thermodesulfovibrionales bacterium]
MKNRILIIEDEPTMRLGMNHFLSSAGYNVKTCEDGAKGISVFEKESFDLVITDLKLPGYDGLAVLKRIRTVSPDAGVIIMTAYADVKTAVQAIREGAFDYIAKPFSNEELLIAIERFLKFQKLEDEVTYLKETLREKVEFEEIIGVSSVIEDVFDRITSVAGTDVPVLIAGESGTGKELVANAIHRLSKRSTKPFVKINCAAIPETLFESELFGHEKGAFTGAAEMRKGKFEFSNGGTIFFDEISDIPISLQSKLLRVLEDNLITRLGGNSLIYVDVRSIYAASKNLKECIALGKFREDLFYRINVVPITIPPLRERKEDIPHLIDHFLKHFKEKFNKVELNISQPAYDALLSYSYPGNVRELKHAIERAVVLSKDGLIDVKHLPDEISGTDAKIPCITEDLSLQESVRCFERQKIIKALNESGGKKIEAAKSLGISRKVLWKKLKEYSIE